MKAYERLLSYVKVFTPSSEETSTSPSTQYQFDLARLLVQELKELGVKDADVDEHCYVYGHIPATRGYESRQKLALSLIWIQSLISAIIRLLRLSLRIMTAKTLHLEPAAEFSPRKCSLISPH